MPRKLLKSLALFCILATITTGCLSGYGYGRRNYYGGYGYRPAYRGGWSYGGGYRR